MLIHVQYTASDQEQERHGGTQTAREHGMSWTRNEENERANEAARPERAIGRRRADHPRGNQRRSGTTPVDDNV